MQNGCLDRPAPRRKNQEIKLEPLVLPPPGGFVLEGKPATGRDQTLNPSITTAVIKVVCGVILLGTIAIIAAGFLIPMFMPGC